MSNILVIGGGTGHALSALLAAKGLHVCLADTPAYAAVFEQTKAAGSIEISGTTQAVGMPEQITTDLASAVQAAELIVCCTVSTRDEEVARAIAPHLTDDKAVLVVAGNGGSLIYHRVFEQAGHGATPLGEVAGNFFPCRLTAPGKILIGLPLSPKGVAAYPPTSSAALAERFREVWELTPCESLFEALFNGPNIICHSAGIAANLSAIDRGTGFNLFTDGLSPAFLNLTDALWEEKRRVYKAMECKVPPAPRGMLSGVMDTRNEAYQYFRQMGGPDNMHNRYITEDIPCLVCFFISIARHMGVEIPLFESILRIITTATGVDYYKQGRTLENLGLDKLSRPDLIAFFRTNQ